MGKEEELKKVIKLITWWIAEIKANNCVNFYDINKVAEDLSRRLLNEIYGYQLENLNYEKNNYPGIDLGDKENHIGFQVTSRRDTRKIQDSLEKFKRIQNEDYSNGIRFFILNQEKKPKLNKDKYRKIYSAFDPEEHIFTADDLIQEITQLYETDINTFYRIKAILEDELEIDTIGIQAKNIINNMAGSKGELNSFIFTLLNQFQNKDLKIVQDYEFPNPVTVPPILPEKISKRKKLINDLLIILENCTWLAIQGEKGIGKTILTLLLIEKFKGSHIWISFRDVKKELSCHHLESAFFAYFGEKISRQKLDSFLCSLFSKLPKHSIVIFDDLPDLSENYNFAQKLIFIEKAAKRNDLKIISSSSFYLSENFKFSVAQNELKIFEIPVFSSDEIGEILNAYETPFNLVKSKFINFISVITGDHPILINALIRHILANNWCSNLEMFEDLLKREFARNEKKEFLTIFSKTVSDDLKELIYRLDLVISGFTDHEIKLVSNIKPRIEKPFEKLNPAFQIWVRSSGNRYSLSPILKGLGEKNLFPDTSKEIYLALAGDIINRRHLNHIEVTHVILYFISAKNYNNAAIMLMNALFALLEVKAERIDDYGIASMWANKPLPEEIELNLRLAIRVLQLKIHEKLNKDVSFILNDLDRLVSDAGEKEMLGLVTVTFHFVTSKTIKKLSTFYKYFLKVSKIPGIDSIFPSSISLEKAMWLCTIHIKTGEDLLEWLNAVEMMSVKSRNALFMNDINMLQSCVIMCENIFLWESEKLQENQNWAEVLKILEEVETRAKNLNLEILWSSAIRTQIIVLAEYMDQFEKAIQLGERSLKIATENPIVQYLLKGIIAKQYLISGDYRTADQWYILAAKQEIESLHILRLFSLLDHCLAVSHLDLKRALKICEKAVIFAEQNAKTISKDLLVMALGEYTILIFQNFGVNDAFESLEKGFEILLKSKKRKALWKNLYMVLGHISGYLSSMAAFGVPPQITPSGDPYLPPKPGMLLHHDDKVQSLYDPSKKFLIFCQLSMFAESIGKDEKAFKWGDSAYFEYKKAFTNIEPIISPIIIRIIVPSLIVEGKYGSSISLSHEIYFALNKERFKNNAAKEINLMPLGEFLIYKNLIPIMLQIARLKILNLINEDEIKHSIDQFRDTHFKKTQINVNLWNSAIKIFEIIFLKKEIIQDEIWQNNFTSGEERGIIMLSFLGNSIVDNILPEFAAQLHASVVPNIELYYKDNQYLYRRVLIPFFKIYWERKFKENKFRFRVPGLVWENMNKAFASKSTEVIKNIIRVVADGLGVGLLNPDFFQKHT